MINLSAKYLVWGSHNAIVGETPPVAAAQPLLVDARSPRKAISKAEARKTTASAKALAAANAEGAAPNRKTPAKKA